MRQSVRNQNWYAALSVALMLPDICSKLQYPELNTTARYPKWVGQYFTPKYTREVGPEHEERVFLTAKDTYALRCVFLHQGELVIEGQPAREVLESFIFIEPHPGLHAHCNRFNNKLQLQVDMFCEDICQATEQWIEDTRDDENIAIRAQRLAQIHDIADTTFNIYFPS